MFLNITRNDRLLRLSNHLHRHYSPYYFIHRHRHLQQCNAQAHYLNGTPYLTTIASNDNVMKILNSSMLSCTLNAVETFKSHSKFELVQPSAIAISVPRSKFSNCLLADYTGGVGRGVGASKCGGEWLRMNVS